MRVKPTLICDFDGTVADSIAMILELINQLAPRYGYRTISPELFEQVRDLPLPKACRAVKFPLHKLGHAIAVVLHEYRKMIPDLEPCPDVVPMLEKLKGQGISLGLISSNHTENLLAWLEHNQIGCFDWVEGTSGILRKHRSIRARIRAHNLDRERVVYLGDEVRDIKAARRNRLKIVSVSWGLHSKSNLLKHNPDRVVNEPHELMEIIPELIS
ncbi:MAG TPA: HAD-IA family hydrolase [Candidatus Syntrophosphaera sp.]|jgi:phosphoglycolate phosphatase|nr:HAD-IA family hydrolase [Candidatus Cloacimonadota bacterium]HOU72016.1 HAD-IA family hydrolase [Candidatus Syntrophosphaera sp.]HOG31674.1 HAD-IA family hydrolase [Candidatus Cloacimonadota bacterium]HQG93781.1 HAD-IA family hydrolase [Candidatus Syntrophosphaera sp.]HQK28684.1 HAD-IA family hydrolase [Candidatus Syntrophosphaera sp.]